VTLAIQPQKKLTAYGRCKLAELRQTKTLITLEAAFSRASRLLV
jgi:hypothetical protein